MVTAWSQFLVVRSACRVFLLSCRARGRDPERGEPGRFCVLQINLGNVKGTQARVALERNLLFWPQVDGKVFCFLTLRWRARCHFEMMAGTASDNRHCLKSFARPTRVIQGAEMTPYRVQSGGVNRRAVPTRRVLLWENLARGGRYPPRMRQLSFFHGRRPTWTCFLLPWEASGKARASFHFDGASPAPLDPTQGLWPDSRRLSGANDCNGILPAPCTLMGRL